MTVLDNVAMTPAGTYPVSTGLLFECNANYRLSGVQLIYCLPAQTGQTSPQWSSNNVPTCEGAILPFSIAQQISSQAILNPKPLSSF